MRRRLQGDGPGQGGHAQRAEQVYASLIPAEKKTAERVFIRLVRPGDETGDTRRRAELSQFDDAARAMARRLAEPDARLLITGRDSGTNQETVEVAHEALIREWGQLGDWVGKVRKQLRDQDLVEELARGWRKHDGGLASGRQLRDFRRAGAPSELAQAFLDASRKRVFKVWAGAGIAVAVLLGALGGFLWWSDDLGLSAKEGVELFTITGAQYRLPTEAEWEYAARAGTEARYWWCTPDQPNCEIKPDVANCNSCASTKGVDGIGKGTLPVGAFPPNPFGLHDTAGNVMEWVEDCWHDNYMGAPDDGTAWKQADDADCLLAVVRGGSLGDFPGVLRSASRGWDDTNAWYGTFGFRLAQDL